MKRRDFLHLGMAASAGAILFKSLKLSPVFAADAPKITDADILKPGEPANVANYCDPKHPKVKGKDLCPNPLPKGNCATCRFFNVTKEPLATHKGKSYGKCQLQGEAKNRYVDTNYVCGTWAAIG